MFPLCLTDGKEILTKLLQKTNQGLSNTMENKSNEPNNTDNNSSIPKDDSIQNSQQKQQQQQDTYILESILRSDSMKQSRRHTSAFESINNNVSIQRTPVRSSSVRNKYPKGKKNVEIMSDKKRVFSTMDISFKRKSELEASNFLKSRQSQIIADRKSVGIPNKSLDLDHRRLSADTLKSPRLSKDSMNDTLDALTSMLHGSGLLADRKSISPPPTT